MVNRCGAGRGDKARVFGMMKTHGLPRLAPATLRPFGVALWLGATLAATLGASTADARTHHHHHLAPAKPLVLVELFTAQGCATCQPADAVLADLAKRKDVLALTFSVDIWDFLGWPDTFAQPEFTARQRAYVKRLKLREMSTPQMLVQGAAHSPGLDPDEIGGLIDDAETPRMPTVNIAKGSRRVSISLGYVDGRPADVWLVRYDPKVRSVSIKTGESRGKTVTETNVVRQLVRLGSWIGAAKSFALPTYAPPTSVAANGSSASVPVAPLPETLKAAVIVQAAHGGEVLSVSRD